MHQDIDFYNDLLIWLGRIGTVLLIAPVLVGVLFRKDFNKPMWLFWQYLLVLVVVSFAEQLFIWSASAHYEVLWKPVFKSLNLTDTNFLSIFSRLPDYLFVGAIFSFVVKRSLGRILNLGSLVLAILAIFVYFFVDGFRSYGTINAVLNRAYLVTVPIIYFWFVFNTLPNISLWRNPFFLIALGLFIPNLFGLLMSFTGSKLYETDYPSFVKISVLRNLLFMASQVLFVDAFAHARLARFLSNPNQPDRKY